MKKKKICISLVDRANYGRLKPLMLEIKKSNFFDLSIICSGSMLINRFGKTVNVVEKDGFKVNFKLYYEIEGSKSVTMAKTTGIAVVEFSNALSLIKPDIFLIIGDRYQTLASAISATYLKIPLIHIQGGEVSGTLDEYARHAITKLSNLHFPATLNSKKNIIRMGENPKTVFNVGCPSSDMILAVKNKIDPKIINSAGVGANINFNRDFIVVLCHPDTINFREKKNEVTEILSSLDKLKLQTIWIWPNIDAGSDDLSRQLRSFREKLNPNWLRLIKNLDPENYIRLIKSARCLVGNSSSFIRESSFFGTPVVMVGNRQNGREHAGNVLYCEISKTKILKSIKNQIKKKYRPSKLYGSGNVSKKIINMIKKYNPNKNKQLYFK